MEHTTVYLSLDEFAVLAIEAGCNVYVIANAHVHPHGNTYVCRYSEDCVCVAAKQLDVDLTPIDPSKPISIEKYN